MAKQEARAPRRVREQCEDLPTLLQWLKDGSLDLERAIAAYNKFSGALQTVQGQAPDDREQGLPILSTKATADGVHVMDIVVDLRDVDPKYLTHVLLPVCESQQRKMLKAIRLLHNVTGKLYHHIVGLTDEDDEAVEPEADDDASAAA